MVPGDREDGHPILDQATGRLSGRDDRRFGGLGTVEQVPRDQEGFRAMFARHVGEAPKGIQHFSSARLRFTPEPTERRFEVNIGDVQQPTHGPGYFT
jgi:hypothetical protein